MNPTFKPAYFGRAPAVLLLAALIVTGFACSNSAGNGDPDPSRDPEVRAVLRQMETETREKKTVSNETFEALTKLREKYPRSALLKGHLKNALIYRSDLAALRALLLENGSTPEDPEEKKILAKADVELGYFSEAASILDELVKTAPKDVELRSLAGLTHFRLGNFDRSAENFDAVWGEITENKMVPEISIRGLVYLNQGKIEEAKKTLESALAIDPDHISTNNSLSRVYRLLGDEEKARELSQKVADLQEKMAADTLVKARRVARKLELEKAWENKRYQDVIDIAELLIPGAESPAEHSILLQYQFNSYKGLGMDDKAEAVRQKAENLAK